MGQVSCRLAWLGAMVVGWTCIMEVASGQLVRAGTMQHFAMSESSGLVVSRRYPGVRWTHNDGANRFLFAMREDGSYIRAFPVAASFVDWEDITMDRLGNLYLADTGADGAARSHVAIHRVREPNPYRLKNIRVERTWYVRFPGQREDCEAFFVSGGFGYLVSKPELGGRATIYGFPLASLARSILLRRIATVDVPGDVTAAAISADSSRLAILTHKGPVLYFLDGNVAGIRSSPAYLQRFENSLMEGASFVPGRGLLVSAETRELWLFTHPVFQVE